MEFVSTDINNVIAIVRRHLYRSIYNNACFLSDMCPLIAENLSCESIDYNPDNYSFNIKISNDASIMDITDTYGVVARIFHSFINKNYDKLVNSMRQEYSNPEDIMNILFSYSNSCSAFGRISRVSNSHFIMNL